MPETVVKPLSKGSIQQLKREAEISREKLLKVKSIDNLQDPMKRLLKLGKQKLEIGDKEEAYICFYKCFTLYTLMIEFPEFKKDYKYYKDMWGPDLSYAMKTLTTLHTELERNYEQMKKQENASITTVQKRNEENHIPPTPAPSQDESEAVNGFGEKKISISSKELYDLVSKRSANQTLILIIDIRVKEDFEESHMKLEDVINIPETVLAKQGITAKCLEDCIEERFKPYFEKRTEYEWIIIVDWFSQTVINNPNIPIDKMFIILTKWDPNQKKKYKNGPIILEGGYDDWLSRFPHVTTNPNVIPPSSDKNNRNSALPDFEYLESLLEPPVVEAEKKPIVPQESITKSVADKDSVPRPTVDRSTKPVFQSKKTESIDSITDESSAPSAVSMSPQSQNMENKNIPKSILKTERIELKKDQDSVEMNRESSDTDEDERLEKYSQRGRRPAVSSKFDEENDASIRDDAHNSYRDENEENEINQRNMSSMKRSSSTPNMLKLNEYSRPTIDRSTKPSNDDQLNIYNTQYGYEIGKGLTGLKNLGNTCYMNSIIQCLSNTEPLRKGLCGSNLRTNERSKTRGAIFREVRNIMSQLWSGDGGSVSCKALKATVGEYRDTFKGYDQQDSHEFLTILIDWLHEDLNCPLTPRVLQGADESSGEKAWGEFVNKNSSIVRELFYGQLKSTVSCSDCGKESVTFEPFSNLSLPLPTEERCSLAECLRLYISDESIPGWQCPSCKKPRNATKKLDITKLPPLLVIHFKRFTSDGWCRKRLTNVDFPNILDMTPFITGLEHRDKRYQLYAVSNHFGTMESGHYTAYCLNAPTQKWYKFDDQDVSPLSSVTKSSSAYIVFYQSLR